MKQYQTALQTSRYRSVRALSSSALRDGRNNIFYIGEKILSLQNVTESLKVGHSSAVNWQQAMAHLKELQHRETELKAIFIEIPFDREELERFSSFLERSDYADVPLVYLTTALTTAELELLPSLDLVDDVINPTRDIFTIRERIAFAGKVREQLNSSTTRISIERKLSDFDSTAQMYKRLFDIMAALLLILLCLPLFIAISLLIRLDSQGPALYNTYRAGRGYRIFKYYQFRTMKVGAERLVTSLSQFRRHHGKESPFFTHASHDPRVTRMGVFLRSTGLDGLPQLFNVLKGDMSFTGKDPLPLYEASKLTTNTEAGRFLCHAGFMGNRTKGGSC